MYEKNLLDKAKEDVEEGHHHHHADHLTHIPHFHAHHVDTESSEEEDVGGTQRKKETAMNGHQNGSVVPSDKVRA